MLTPLFPGRPVAALGGNILQKETVYSTCSIKHLSFALPWKGTSKRTFLPADKLAGCTTRMLLQASQQGNSHNAKNFVIIIHAE